MINILKKASKITTYTCRPENWFPSTFSFSCLNTPYSSQDLSLKNILVIWTCTSFSHLQFFVQSTTFNLNQWETIGNKFHTVPLVFNICSFHKISQFNLKCLNDGNFHYEGKVFRSFEELQAWYLLYTRFGNSNAKFGNSHTDLYDSLRTNRTNHHKETLVGNLMCTAPITSKS